MTTAERGSRWYYDGRPEGLTTAAERKEQDPIESSGSHRLPRSRRAWLSVALGGLLPVLVSLLTGYAAEAPTVAHTAASAPVRTDGNSGGSFYFPIVEPTNLDPAAVSWYDVHGPIVGQVFEGLTQLDDELEAVPAIARSWETTDAKNWRFHLRAGVRFHNGNTLTPEDVEYSFGRVAADGNMWYDATVAPLIDTVTVVDTDTLQITLHEPFAAFPSLLALPFMSVVPSETVGTIHDNPVGSGPFRFQSWTPGDSIVLEANEDCRDDCLACPERDRVYFSFDPSEDAMYEDFLQGGLDLSPVPDDRVS